jgi:hypothetical protein
MSHIDHLIRALCRSEDLLRYLDEQANPWGPPGVIPPDGCYWLDDGDRPNPHRVTLENGHMYYETYGRPTCKHVAEPSKDHATWRFARRWERKPARSNP